MTGKVLAVVALAAVAAVAGAADTNTEIVVTASRNNRQACQIPANVTVMTAADIEKGGYGNIVEALRDAGGISFRSSSGNESQSELQMRGFGENSQGRLLVLVDGRKLNRPDMAGLNWLQVPVGNVDRVEILRGSDSATYGDHAVGGVINIVTKKGTPEPQGYVHAAGGSYGENTQRAGYSGSGGKLSYALNVERQQVDGYRERSAFSALGGGGSLSYDISDAWNAGIDLSISQADYEIPGWLTREQVESDPRQYGNPDDSAENKYYSANFKTTRQFGDSGSASLGVVFGRTDIESDMTSWGSYADNVIDTLGIMPGCVLNSSIAGHDNKLLLGVDYYVDSLGLDRFAGIERGEVISSADVEKQTIGVFLRNELQVTEALMLGVGGRLEKADVSGKMSTNGAACYDDTKRHNASSVNMSANYRFLEDSKVFVRAGTIYRYPFVDEQVSYWGYASDHFNGELKAEAGTDFQAGAEVGLNRILRAGLTLFLMNMRDEIAYDPDTSENENMDSTRHSGAEASASWVVVSWLEMDANYTFTRALFTDGANDGKDIPLVPRHAGTVGATVLLPMDLSLRVSVRHNGEMYLAGDYANEMEKLDGYTVAGLSLRCTPAKVDGLDVFVSVDNIFDAEYSSLGYIGYPPPDYARAMVYYPSPGRTFKAGVAYRF